MPLSCGLMVSYARSFPELDDVYFEILMLDTTIDDLVNEIESPWIVGIACYCWNFLGCIDLSYKIKEKFPECLIVWGGSQVPVIPNLDYMNRHPEADILVHGEGELTFADLLIKLKNNIDLRECLGITYKDNKEYLSTNPRDRLQDLSLIPSPYLTGVFDNVLQKYRHNISGVLWETNRGCPFSCSFCDWGQAVVNKVHFFDVDRVVKEIEWGSDNKIQYVYATDANFGIKADRDLEIATRLVEISSKTGYPNTLVVNWTKNSHKNIVKIADVLMRGNIKTNVTLSYQSLHQPTLNAIQRQNIKPSYLQELKREYHKRGIPTYGELILGLPEETYDTFLDGLEKSVGMNIHDQIMVYLCCILENTELKKDKEKYGIQTRRCAVGLNRRRSKYVRFGEDEIVVATNSMPIDDWKKLYDISFLFMSLYNLRVSFYIIVFLHFHCNIKFTELVKFILSLDLSKYVIFGEAIQHLQNNRNLILANLTSVSAPKGSEGVVFTPHEAMTFIFFSNIQKTYEEMKNIVKMFCDKNDLVVPKSILDDLFDYQQMMIPTFTGELYTHKFSSNIPEYLDMIINNKQKFPLVLNEISASFTNILHDYDNEIEFNRRRVSCGYNIALNHVEIL